MNGKSSSARDTCPALDQSKIFSRAYRVRERSQPQACSVDIDCPEYCVLNRGAVERAIRFDSP